MRIRKTNVVIEILHRTAFSSSVSFSPTHSHSTIVFTDHIVCVVIITNIIIITVIIVTIIVCSNSVVLYDQIVGVKSVKSVKSIRGGRGIGRVGGRRRDELQTTFRVFDGMREFGEMIETNFGGQHQQHHIFFVFRQKLFEYKESSFVLMFTHQRQHKLSPQMFFFKVLIDCFLVQLSQLSISPHIAHTHPSFNVNQPNVRIKVYLL